MDTDRTEKQQWSSTHRLEKFDATDYDPETKTIREGAVPIEVIEDRTTNVLTTAGAAREATLLIGTGQAMDATHTLLGVGNSSTTATVADTGLGAAAGSSNQYWMVPDATYPSASGGTITVKATWATGDGNFTWNEWGIQITTSAASSGASPGAGAFMNHKVASLGVKSSGAWALSVTISLA